MAWPTVAFLKSFNLNKFRCKKLNESWNYLRNTNCVVVGRWHKIRRVVVVILNANVEIHLDNLLRRSQIFHADVQAVIPVESIEFSSCVDTSRPWVHLLKCKHISAWTPSNFKPQLTIGSGRVVSITGSNWSNNLFSIMKLCYWRARRFFLRWKLDNWCVIIFVKNFDAVKN